MFRIRVLGKPYIAIRKACASACVRACVCACVLLFGDVFGTDKLVARQICAVGGSSIITTV